MPRSPRSQSNLRQRLEHCKVSGGMTTADLAIWFGRPHCTIRTWLNGATPRGPQGELALQRLRRLEWAIQARHSFPLDQTESQTARPETVRRIRDDIENDRVLARRSA